jgi:hypothetical protein
MSTSERLSQQNLKMDQFTYYIRKILISLGKMIGTRRPRAVDRMAIRLGGNGIEENFPPPISMTSGPRRKNFPPISSTNVGIWR